MFGVARRPGSFAVLARINDAALTGELVAKLKLRENGPDEWVGERVVLRRWTKAGVVLVAHRSASLSDAAGQARRSAHAGRRRHARRAGLRRRRARRATCGLVTSPRTRPGATTTTLVASLGKDGLRIEDSSSRWRDHPAARRRARARAREPDGAPAVGARCSGRRSRSSARRITRSRIRPRDLAHRGGQRREHHRSSLERMLEDGLGLTSRDVESLLGDEIAFGVYLDPEPAKGRDLYSRIAVGVAVDVGDEARIAAVLEKLQKSIKGAKSVGPIKSLVVDDKDKRFEVGVEGRRLFVAFGAKSERGLGQGARLAESHAGHRGRLVCRAQARSGQGPRVRVRRLCRPGGAHRAQ